MTHAVFKLAWNSKGKNGIWWERERKSGSAWGGEIWHEMEAVIW